MSRAGLIAASLVLMIGVLWWLAMRGPAAHSTLLDAGASGSDHDQLSVTQPTQVAGAQPIAAPAAQATPQKTALKPAANPAQEPAVADQEERPAPRLDGPIQERKQRFASEPRDSAAAQYDALIEDAFRDQVPRELLKSALCRETICRLEIRWSSERNTGYMLALTRLLPRFEHEIAVAPTAALGGDGVMPLEVYLKRLPEPLTP